MEVLQQHVDRDVPELQPELGRCQELLGGMMAKNRDERFASARSLLDSLHAAAV